MGRAFATAVTAFIVGASPGDWPPYAPGAIARIRHFD